MSVRIEGRIAAASGGSTSPSLNVSVAAKLSLGVEGKVTAASRWSHARHYVGSAAGLGCWIVGKFATTNRVSDSGYSFSHAAHLGLGVVGLSVAAKSVSETSDSGCNVAGAADLGLSVVDLIPAAEGFRTATSERMTIAANMGVRIEGDGTASLAQRNSEATS